MSNSVKERYDNLGLNYKTYGNGNISLIRSRVSLTLRKKLSEKFNGTCPICGFVGILTHEYLYKHYTNANGEVFHLDHIIPKCMGGTDDENNLRLICPSCNRRKGGKYAQSNP
jgi:HNH endonuclease.